MSRTGRAGGFLFALALGAVAVASDAPETGRVKGRVVIGIDKVSPRSVAPLVVFLEGVDVKVEYVPSAVVPKISQKNAKFSPDFLVIAAGQTVEMPNDDAIFHNVFSYSKPNQFDLGMYAKGESRRVTFAHPGAVRIYCSIHSSMDAVIFVAPSPWHARVDASGAFEMRDVKPGRYRLKLWSSLVPEESRVIEVASGKETAVELAIAATGPEKER